MKIAYEVFEGYYEGQRGINEVGVMECLTLEELTLRLKNKSIGLMIEFDIDELMRADLDDFEGKTSEEIDFTIDEAIERNIRYKYWIVIEERVKDFSIKFLNDIMSCLPSSFINECCYTKEYTNFEG